MNKPEGAVTFRHGKRPEVTLPYRRAHPRSLQRSNAFPDGHEPVQITLVQIGTETDLGVMIIFIARAESCLITVALRLGTLVDFGTLVDLIICIRSVLCVHTNLPKIV